MVINLQRVKCRTLEYKIVKFPAKTENIFTQDVILDAYYVFSKDKCCPNIYHTISLSQIHLFPCAFVPFVSAFIHINSKLLIKCVGGNCSHKCGEKKANNGHNQNHGGGIFTFDFLVGCFSSFLFCKQMIILINCANISYQTTYVLFLKGSQEKTICTPASGMVSSTILQASPE